MQHLRSFASQFTALSSQVKELAWTPGSDLLAKITPLLQTSTQLTVDVVGELTALDGSPYVAVPGSRPALDALAGAVGAASSASADLAAAVASNPLHGTGFPGPPEDADAVREARHAHALPLITEHLAAAVQGFDLAATCCAYVATGITNDLERAAAAEKLPKLNDGQHRALEALAHGEGRRTESGRMGAIRIRTADGSLIHAATFAFFEKHDLVRIETKHSLYRGQTVTITSRARRLLARHSRAAHGPTAVTRPQPQQRVTQR
ncbi:hypothetical protein ACWFR1_21865 [Streptomyces sp. NPDC055103]